jgi:hypothetical protein
MTYLTEAEVLARLRAAVRRYPTIVAFSKAHGIDGSLINSVLNGYYNNGAGGVPPSVLLAIGVRKQVVYMLAEDAKERAA